MGCERAQPFCQEKSPERSTDQGKEDVKTENTTTPEGRTKLCSVLQFHPELSLRLRPFMAYSRNKREFSTLIKDCVKPNISL